MRPGFLQRLINSPAALRCVALAAFCTAAGGCGSAAQASASATRSGANEMKMLVLGMDGLDPKLVEKLMAEGKLPHFQQLAEKGVFTPLQTSMPPQSPVAWSNFISGAHPGVHQIYDFVHRKTTPAVAPYESIAVKEETPDGAFLSWGKDWVIPTGGGGIVAQRRGPNFWEPLIHAGVDTTIYRVPANYPPPVEIKGRGAFRCLCGMGTPDLLGSNGIFTAFREAEKREMRDVGGGRIIKLKVENDHATGVLEGPDNFLRRVEKGKKAPPLTVEVDIVRDPEENIASVTVGGVRLVMKQGEWSDWVPIEFKTGVPWSPVVSLGFPTSLPAMVRFYLKEVHPNIDLYVSPMNIDPQNAAMPISTPTDFAEELAKATGRFYSTGIPEDTKALRERVWTEDEFLGMVENLVAERMRQYDYALSNFDHGFLFFYFGHTDQLAHVFWRDIDPGHPGRKPEQEGKYDKVIENAYIEMDGVVAKAMEKIGDNDILIVMSDHGFGSFRRGLNVNTWLLQEGYLSIRNDSAQAREYFTNFDWNETEAYAMGINGLYLNLRGREPRGIVDPSQRRKKMEEIAAKMLKIRDEETGAKVIDKMYIVEDIYPGADPKIAPDMLIGFAENYRGSWATALGGQPKKLIEDNKDRWSGDHCVAAHLVPGTLLCNRKISVDAPSLSDLAPSILELFGAEAPEGMIGRKIFGPPSGGHAHR